MENRAPTLIYLLSDIHPPKRFLIIHNGIICFHLFASFSLPSIFPVITSGLPHQFHSLKLEEKEGGGEVLKIPDSSKFCQKYFSQAFCKQKTGE